MSYTDVYICFWKSLFFLKVEKIQKTGQVGGTDMKIQHLLFKDF